MSAALRSDATALDAVAALLGPITSRDGGRRSYAVLPRTTRPRYLVPVAGRIAAAAHIRPSRSAGGAAIRHLVLRPALRLGAGRVLPGALRVPDGDDADPSLRRHLARLVGRDDVELAIALGAPRPNRKPVIQVIAGGRTLGWAKLGVDDHTDALVEHETRALAGARPGPPIVAPEVLAAGSWRGHRLLVLGHLSMTETAADLDLTAEAIRAIAGPIAVEAVATSRWWGGLRAEAAVPGADPPGAVADMLDTLEPRFGDRTWPFGSWHGDLAPWNATWEGERLVLWDWERSTGPVPLGIDLVHNRVQTAMLDGGGMDLAGAIDDVVARDAATLVELGYGSDEVSLVVSAYLATLRVRYARDALHGSLGPGAAIAAAIDDTHALGGRRSVRK